MDSRTQIMFAAASFFLPILVDLRSWESIESQEVL